MQHTNRDFVVIINAHQVTQLQMPGKRSCFTGNSLHGAAVTKETKGPVADQVVPGFVEHARNVCLRNSQPNRIGKTLTQRTRSDFDSRCLTGLWMSRRLTVQLLIYVLAFI